VIYTVNSNNKL